jgi:2-keto-4-pentenoate hydratase
MADAPPAGRIGDAAIREAARILADARRDGATRDALPASCRPATLDDAHAIEVATAAHLGDAIAGWKVAATPDGHLARGAMLRSRLVASGAHLDAATMPLLGVECEIAFRFDTACPARDRAYAYDDVAASVTALPAIEVVDSRFRGYPNAPFLDRVADCMSNGAFVAGTPRDDWRAFDLARLAAELVIDDATVVNRVGGHPTRDPLLPAVALANDLRTTVGIAAGTIVTTGTYTGLNFARPGQRVTARFQGFGSATVTFDRGR